VTGAGFTAALAGRAMGLRPAELPDDVVELARQCVLDWFGVTLAGSREECATIVLEELGSAAAPVGPGATVLGHPDRLGARDAAVVNGTASHALDYDDVNQAMFGHPTVPVVPGLLALAETTGSSGAEVLCAFVAGYEAECAVARALGAEHYQRGFHATATAGTFGAAIACAHLLGLDGARAEAALGIAATQAAGLKSMFGTMCKPLHAGLASAAGLFAARLAARGFSSAPGAIEGVQGFGETHAAGFDAERGLSEPPRGWYLRSHLFKYHAACYETHSSIEGLRAIRDAEHVSPADIEAVTIHADAAQMRMCAIEEPTTGLEAKFSLLHTAAMVLAGRDTSAIETFDDATVGDPAVLALRARIAVVPDRVTPGPTPVEVRTGDGRVLSRAHDTWAPETDLDRQRDRIAAKFASLAAPVVGGRASATIAQMVGQLEDLDRVAGLMAAARGELPA
jgi:2-methylcitrate dehydratase PrpD